VSGGEQPTPTRHPRREKTARDLRAVRFCATGAASALRQIAELLRLARIRGGELHLRGEPLTLGRLGREVTELLGAFGLTQPRGMILAPGEAGAAPAWGELDPGRILRPGEPLLCHLRPRVLSDSGEGLFAECARTFCVGPVPEPVARAHGVLLEAFDRAWERLAPRHLAANPKAFSLQDAVFSHFRRHGYEHPLTHPGSRRGAVHEIGHGIGFAEREPPFPHRGLGPEGDLRAGDLLALHPGLYEPAPDSRPAPDALRVPASLEAFGVRLGDLIHLREDGPEWLTPLPHALDPRAW